MEVYRLADEQKELITARDFARLKGKQDSWGSRLAMQANKKGFSHPTKTGNYWVSTVEEWEDVLRKLGLQLRDRADSYKK